MEYYGVATKLFSSDAEKLDFKDKVIPLEKQNFRRQ
jgi:hypothetical protein